MTAALYDVIARRRDVRAEFTGAPVADDVLLRVLDAAHRAPSVGMTQPWDFVVVRDPALRRTFRDHVTSERDVFAASLPEEALEKPGVHVIEINPVPSAISSRCGLRSKHHWP